MESTDSTRERATGKDVKQDANNTVLMSSKPLHRFIKNEPKSLGIVIVIFGCAELLMGFNLATENEIYNSGRIYIPFWQGLLFLVSGSLSIYTEVHPSKKTVTACLAMYVVSILGIVVSCGYRIFCLSHLSYLHFRSYYYSRYDHWDLYRVMQNSGIEGILFTSSLCVSVILILLCVFARSALKSTRTQVIVQRIPAAPQSETQSI
ncbi:B-lymphocyte antigen CD20-like [Labrus mixtus]|uniref:B-lymphocyte antigen CD20-like n=1 Tax=Labrus mixtus TaxID=508554 RepID=UPI0029C0C1CF|nr:B-lymphocyte antigen CD20-like [Labrus mixtus]